MFRMSTSDLTDELDLDLIVAVVLASGVHAEVEQTGGGVAAVYAGTRDSDGRWTAIAGSGWFDGPDCTVARASREMFVVGRDDDEDSLVNVSEDDDEESIAARLVSLCDA